MQMNDSGNALIQVPLFCPRFTENFDVATLSISMLKNDMFFSRRQIHSPQFHRFTVLEMNMSRSVSPRSGKRQHADPVCACQKGDIWIVSLTKALRKQTEVHRHVLLQNFPLHLWVCTCSSVEISVFTKKRGLLAKSHPQGWQGLKPTFLTSQECCRLFSLTQDP